MNYMQFKEEVIKNIKGYLPEKYCEWELKTEMVYKVNEPCCICTDFTNTIKADSPLTVFLE